MLRLEMLAADYGDALLLEYGPGTEVKHRILIDGGPGTAYEAVRSRLLDVPTNRRGRRKFDLLMISHVDADHIEGVIKLLQDDEVAADFGDVWFNDWNHLEPLVEGETPAHLGPEQGEFLGALLLEQERPWNRAFDGGTIVQTEPGRALPARTVGGMRLTIVSPTIETLITLRKTWKKAIEAAGFQPGSAELALKQFKKRRWANAPAHLGFEDQPATLDHAPANGSSIAVIAEYGGIRLLLGADAHADVLRPALDRWREAKPAERGVDGRVRLDAFKLAHHGSEHNMTPELMAAIECPTYLVSSNGAKFRHPNVEAIKQLIAGHRGAAPPEVRFNYRSPQTSIWEGRPELNALYGADTTLEWETA